MKIRQIIESTTAGSIATVASPLGATQSRTQKPPKAPKVVKGKKYANTLSEGQIKRIATDMDELSDAAFKKKYGKTKQEMRKELKEDEIVETDFILVPGQMKGKDKSFTPHEKDRTDHEVEMARKELYAAAQDAMRIFKLIQNRSEDEGLMGWQQSYITLASDYLNSVADSLANVPMKEGAGVIAGGMSNFEEGRYYDPMGDERREQGAMDAERRRFKWDELSQELKGEEERARKYEQGPWYILINGKLVKDKSKNPYTFNTLSGAQKAVKTMREKEWNKDKKFEYTRTPKDSGMTEAKAHKCPECGGEMVSEELMNEKKDACYYKVKSRYKVWPSAYASGALVKCRKKGSKNWGNKSK